MTDFIDVMAIEELPVGRIRAVDAGGRRIALYHTTSGFFASDNSCPHRGGPLHEGDLIGDEIICPWHLWGFDIASGVCTGNPAVTIAVHEVRVENGRVLLRVP